MATKKSPAPAALIIETRTAVGTTGARAARREGKIPGVLYGHGESQAIQIDAKIFAELLHGASRGKVVDAKVDGKSDSVFLRTIERDPVSHHPISADFQRITKGEAIHATIAVHTTGIAPGVRDSGGVMEVISHTIDVKGPADQIPDGVTVDVGALEVHDHISAGDVKLPAGFTLVTTPDTVLVSIGASRTAAQAEADQAGPDAGGRTCRGGRKAGRTRLLDRARNADGRRLGEPGPAIRTHAPQHRLHRRRRTGETLVRRRLEERARRPNGARPRA